MDQDRIYWLGFSAFPGIGPIRFGLLLEYFGSAKKAWEASLGDLLSIHLSEKLARKFNEFRNNFSLTNFAQELKDKNIKYLILRDSHYPKLLKQISDAPFVLYVKGKKTDVPWDIGRSIGIVGTRRITNYGKLVTEKITRELVSYGFTIVSGMAYGVDTQAHTSAINAGGRTIAVLGCGIDIIHPKSNTNLYNEIINGKGAVLSEWPPGMMTAKGLFPSRNRIISGLSLGVVVTEGALDSGALITARYAAEQGREVFAIPGPITSSLSFGPTKLLKNGAKLVTEVQDILEELKLSNKQINQLSNKQIKKTYSNLSEEEMKIIKILENEDLLFDEIVRKSKISTTKVGSILSLMEIKGIIQNSGGMYGIKT